MNQLCCICYNVDMKYNIIKDIEVVCTLLNLSYSKLAESLNVSRSTISRIVKGETYPSDLLLEAFYSFAYKNNIRAIRLNDLKTQFAIDKYDKILFHGTKGEIVGDIDLKHSRNNIDIGVGFYLGENFEQASSYIFPYSKSSVYIFDTRKLEGMKTIEFAVSLEWMLMVSYYRGYIKPYENSNYIKKLINEVEKADVIVAPIADNDMYETMSQFARGDITDLQAVSALSASNLGKQHVLKSTEACQMVKMVERLYLCSFERNDIEAVRKENAQVDLDKSTIAIKTLRRQGKYIEEVLNDD